MTTQKTSEGSPSAEGSSVANSPCGGGTGLEPGRRLVSLDVLRGFDMLFIMGFSVLVQKLCTAFGWGGNCWLSQQMAHVDWNGLTHHDTIFPLFLFIAGVAWPFSCAKQVARGDSPRTVALRCLKRAVLLAALGVIYTGFLGNFEKYRFTTVLARIGFAWMFAAWLYLFAGMRTRIAVAAALLVGYWVFSVLVGAPDHPGASPLSPEGCFTGWLDRTYMPGIILGPKGANGVSLMDNQSLLGIFPATVTAMLGVFAGEFLRAPAVSGRRKTVRLLLAAAALLVAGLFVAFGFGRWSMPINKKLWSSSFVLVVGAYSTALLAAFYWLIDVKGWWRHHLFFKVIGMNSITIYLAQVIIPFKPIAANLFGGTAALLPPAWGTVLLSAGYIAVCWFFLYFLYRKNVFLKV